MSSPLYSPPAAAFPGALTDIEVQNLDREDIMDEIERDAEIEALRTSTSGMGDSDTSVLQSELAEVRNKYGLLEEEKAAVQQQMIELEDEKATLVEQMKQKYMEAKEKFQELQLGPCV